MRLWSPSVVILCAQLTINDRTDETSLRIKMFADRFEMKPQPDRRGVDTVSEQLLVLASRGRWVINQQRFAIT